MRVYMCLCMVRVCARSEDNLRELVLSFHRVRPGIQTQVVGFSGLHLLSHLARPVSASKQLPTPVCKPSCLAETVDVAVVPACSLEVLWPVTLSPDYKGPHGFTSFYL